MLVFHDTQVEFGSKESKGGVAKGLDTMAF